MARQTFPRNVDELIEMLEEQYPPRCIGPNEDLREHDRYAGKVELVEELRTRQRLDEQKG